MAMVYEDEFLRQADTGDLLLYKSSGFNQKVLRTVTNGSYDHVAIILKFEADPNELYIIEATSTDGVVLRKWSEMRLDCGPKMLYETVVFRHIDYVRTMETCNIL